MIKIIKLRKYSDKRGSLVENTLTSIVTGSKHFFVSKSKPGVVRGNHYHKKKKEWFYLIQGKCIFYIKDIISKKTEFIELNDKDNSIIQVEPNKAHAIKNTGKNEMILLALVNEPLDKKSPDTYSYIVI